MFWGHIPSVSFSHMWKLISVYHLHHQLAAPEPAMMGDSIPQGTRKWHFSVVRHALIRIIRHTHPELEFQKQTHDLVTGTVAWEAEPGTASPSADSGQVPFSLCVLVSLNLQWPSPKITTNSLSLPSLWKACVIPSGWLCNICLFPSVVNFQKQNFDLLSTSLQPVQET